MEMTPPKAMQSRSPASTNIDQNTAGGPAINISMAERIKNHPEWLALVLAVIALLWTWYGEREGRLAQYAAATVAGNQSNTDAQVELLKAEIGFAQHLNALQAEVDKLSQQVKEKH